MPGANRRSYGQWASASPSRFIAELPQDQVDGDTTMSGGGASPWRSQFTERAAPFTDIGRGPGWQRAAAGGGFSRGNARLIEARAKTVSTGPKPRRDRKSTSLNSSH